MRQTLCKAAPLCPEGPGPRPCCKHPQRQQRCSVAHWPALGPTSHGAGQTVGSAHLRDSGTNREMAVPYYKTTSTFGIYEFDSATAIDFDTPWTWASTDNVWVNLNYLMA